MDDVETLNDSQNFIECIIVLDLSIYSLLLIVLHHSIITNEFTYYILIFIKRMNVLQLQIWCNYYWLEHLQKTL